MSQQPQELFHDKAKTIAFGNFPPKKRKIPSQLPAQHNSNPKLVRLRFASAAAHGIARSNGSVNASAHAISGTESAARTDETSTVASSVVSQTDAARHARTSASVGSASMCDAAEASQQASAISSASVGAIARTDGAVGVRPTHGSPRATAAAAEKASATETNAFATQTSAFARSQPTLPSAQPTPTQRTVQTQTKTPPASINPPWRICIPAAALRGCDANSSRLHDSSLPPLLTLSSSSSTTAPPVFQPLSAQSELSRLSNLRLPPKKRGRMHGPKVQSVVSDGGVSAFSSYMQTLARRLPADAAPASIANTERIPQPPPPLPPPANLSIHFKLPPKQPPTTNASAASTDSSAHAPPAPHGSRGACDQSCADHASAVRKSDSAASSSSSSNDPFNTRTRALAMIRWAVQNNAWLDAGFELVSLLGWGGCGAVLGAIRRTDRKEVAIKVIYRTEHLHVTSRGVPVEIDVQMSVCHPNIVGYCEHSSDDRAFYLVMERFGLPWRNDGDAETIVMPRRQSGPSLQLPDLKPTAQTPPVLLHISRGSSASLFDYIDQFGRVPPYLLRSFFAPLASAVHTLHSARIVHGDIKEKNILVGLERSKHASSNDKINQKRAKVRITRPQIENGSISTKLFSSSSDMHRHIIKICDFGHARYAKRISPNMRYYGTRDVSAPELIDNLRANDAQQHHDDEDDSDNDHDSSVGEKRRSRHRTTHANKRSRKDSTVVMGFAQDIWALGIVLYTMIHGSLPPNNDAFVNGEIDLNGCQWYPTKYDETIIPPECLDLLRRMLAIDPKRRITIDQVMQHPWLKLNQSR